jgi:hypothetical protein
VPGLSGFVRPRWQLYPRSAEVGSNAGGRTWTRRAGGLLGIFSEFCPSAAHPPGEGSPCVRSRLLKRKGPPSETRQRPPQPQHLLDGSAERLDPSSRQGSSRRPSTRHGFGSPKPSQQPLAPPFRLTWPVSRRRRWQPSARAPGRPFMPLERFCVHHTPDRGRRHGDSGRANESPAGEDTPRD